MIPIGSKGHVGRGSLESSAVASSVGVEAMVVDVGRGGAVMAVVVAVVVDFGRRGAVVAVRLCMAKGRIRCGIRCHRGALPSLRNTDDSRENQRVTWGGVFTANGVSPEQCGGVGRFSFDIYLVQP